MKFFGNHFLKLLFITLLSVVGWGVNLISSNYNPYTNFVSLCMPDKYLIADTLIITKEEIWDSSPILDQKTKHYSFYGYLKGDKNLKKKIFNLTWKVGDNPKKFIKDSLMLKEGLVSYIPVFKSKIQNYSIYPKEDSGYIMYERFEDFVSVIFFSIPFVTIPIFIYLFYLGYLERKQKK